MNIQQNIYQLREELNKHNHNYYVLDNPIISDFDFDLKLKQLQILESAPCDSSLMMGTWFLANRKRFNRIS